MGSALEGSNAGSHEQVQALQTRPERQLQAEDAQPQYIVAVIENRAKEVGLAALDALRMKLYLTQFVETSRSYTNTLSLLEEFPPSELCIVAAKDAQVSTGVNRATRSYNQVPLPRGSFDDTQGSLLASDYATPEYKASIGGATLHTSYLALGSAGALLRYLEQERRMVLAAGSLHVMFIGTSSHMHIDSASVRALELIQPLQVGVTRFKHSSSSLFRLLNHTKTACGMRLLRANLLQPLTDVATLSMRQDSVQELVQGEDMRYNLQACLEKLPTDLDKMCGSFALRPQAPAVPARRIAAIVQSCILLKDTLQLLETVTDSLAPAQSELLQAVRVNCGHPAFAQLLAQMQSVLDEEAQSAKASFPSTTEQCFAVKSGVNGLLDLARANFCRITEDIHQLASDLRAKHSLDWLKASYSARRGFYFVTAAPGHKSANGSVAPALPRELAKVDSKSKTTITCTTRELSALNLSLKAAANDCLVLTEQVLEGAVAEVAEHLGTLHKLIDNLALLDMLCSFALVAALNSPGYVRPRCNQQGPIVIVGGRHPILEQVEDVEFQANDTYLAECGSFLILTGPNMSGKSTYLRQVALIVVMAQIGCYVPAKFAAIRMVDHLFTRIGSADSIETNCSSFTVEMQEAAYVCDQATARSLVIIDELGRATCTTDGVGISWAIAEHLISLGCFTLFATHFAHVMQLAYLYPNCKLWHLDVDTSGDRLNFRWKLKAGPQEAGHYGLLLAPIVGIPDEITQEAGRVVQRLTSHERKCIKLRASKEHTELAAVYSLGHKVHCVAAEWADSEGSGEVAAQLEQLQLEAKRLVTITTQS